MQSGGILENMAGREIIYIIAQFIALQPHSECYKQKKKHTLENEFCIYL